MIHSYYGICINLEMISLQPSLEVKLSFLFVIQFDQKIFRIILLVLAKKYLRSKVLIAKLFKLLNTLVEELTLTTYIEILVLFNIQCKQFKKCPSLLNSKTTF